MFSCSSRTPPLEAKELEGSGIKISLTPDGPPLPADGPRKVKPGSKVYISSRLLPAEIARPDLSLMGRVYDYSQRNSRPIVMNDGARTKVDDHGQVTYQLEMEVYKKPGVYYLQVSYDDKIVDEIAIEVTADVDE